VLVETCSLSIFSGQFPLNLILFIYVGPNQFYYMYGFFCQLNLYDLMAHFYLISSSSLTVFCLFRHSVAQQCVAFLNSLSFVVHTENSAARKSESK
jgi:hypothetical protein